MYMHSIYSTVRMNILLIKKGKDRVYEKWKYKASSDEGMSKYKLSSREDLRSV